MTRIETNATGVNMTRNVGGTADALASEKSRGRAGRAHLVGTTRTRPKALPLPARHERGEGRGEGSVYSFDVLPGVSFVIRLVVPSKRAPSPAAPAVGLASLTPHRYAPSCVQRGLTCHSPSASSARLPAPSSPPNT